jgi:hypothetical protein
VAPARTKPERNEEGVVVEPERNEEGVVVGLDVKAAGWGSPEENPRPCLNRRAPSPLRLSSS